MDQVLTAITEIEDEATQRFVARERTSRATEEWRIASLVACGVVASGSLLMAVAMWHARNRERTYLAVLTASDAERRRSEIALRESEERFRAIAETIPNLLYQTDANGHVVYTNGNLKTYIGMRLEELPTDSWVGLVHPDDRERSLAAWREAAESGQPLEVEFRCRRHDGAYHWFLSRSVPLRDADGALVHWIGTATDIDDQKQAEAVLSQHRDELERLVGERTAALAAREAELSETAARYRLMTDHSSDMVARTGADGTIQYVSPAGERLLGVNPSELTVDLVLQMVHPDDLALLQAMRARLLAGVSESEMIGYRMTRADGRLIWVETTARALRDAATGAPDGFVSVMRDVSERRKLEEALRHAQKMETIGRISAGVAHDFNNILQTVIGGLELTLDSMEAGAPGRDFAELALGSATRGSALTHHLLAYARKQILQPRLVELAPFLCDMQRLLSRTLGPHIRVRIDVAHGTPPICVDPTQLETALLNLAINGADAMREGGTLTIGAEPAAGDVDPRLVALRVVDDGVGMDQATLAQACEPFFTTKGVEGTGLGLSMVQGFAEQSGGKLRLESELGRGTTVVLLFDAALGVAKKLPDMASLPQPSRRALVVDDEPDVLVTAGAFLERAGLWVVRASSGDEALAALAGDLPFDVLVTDYAMPGMNGADLAIEGQSLRPGLPVLIITGFAEVRGLDELPARVHLLHKPFRRDDLLKALWRVMMVGGDAFPMPNDIVRRS